MANPHKGEVAFEADGKTYTLRYSYDALCVLEEVSGFDGPQLVGKLNQEKWSFTLLRQMAWAGLREHHPDLDLKAAGELIIAAGGAVVILGKVARALQLAFPPPSAPERPQMPGSQNGTGPASIDSGQASAGTKRRSGGERRAN